MKELFILIGNLLTTLVRLAQPRGVRSVVVQSLALKHQLLVLQRMRKRAPSTGPGGSIRITHQIAHAFGVNIDEDVVHPVLARTTGQATLDSVHPSIARTARSAAPRQYNPPAHHHLPQPRLFAMPGASTVVVFFRSQSPPDYEFATDRRIPISEAYLRAILKSRVEHYNRGRLHGSLGPGVPVAPLCRIGILSFVFLPIQERLH